MKTIKTAAAALLIAALPLTQAAYAHERDDRMGDRREWRYERADHDRGWDHREARHYRHDYRYNHRHGHDYRYGDDSGYRYPAGYRVEQPSVRVVLPLPPLPVIVVPKVVARKAVVPLPPIPAPVVVVPNKHHRGTW